MVFVIIGVDLFVVDDLNEYINLNYFDLFLEIRVVKVLDKEEFFIRFYVILILYFFVIFLC